MLMMDCDMVFEDGLDEGSELVADQVVLEDTSATGDLTRESMIRVVACGLGTRWTLADGRERIVEVGIQQTVTEILDEDITVHTEIRVRLGTTIHPAADTGAGLTDEEMGGFGMRER
jgi:hypothetical protein